MVASILAKMANIDTTQTGLGFTVNTTGELRLQLTFKNTIEREKFDAYYEQYAGKIRVESTQEIYGKCRAEILVDVSVLCEVLIPLWKTSVHHHSVLSTH